MTDPPFDSGPPVVMLRRLLRFLLRQFMLLSFGGDR